MPVMDIPKITPAQLAAFRRRARLTQEALASELGVSRGAYKNWEYGHAQVPQEVAAQLIRMGALNEVGGPLIPAPNLLVPIPFIGSVSAGSPVDWIDPFESNEFQSVPPEMADSRYRFACRADGDSMFDLIYPGDLLVFERTDIPKIGAVVLYRHHDGRVTVKQLKHDGSRYILHALNPLIEDCHAEGAMIGYLVGIVRQDRSRRVTVYDPHGIIP